LIDFQVARRIKQGNISFENSIDYKGTIGVASCCGSFVSKNLLSFKRELYEH